MPHCEKQECPKNELSPDEIVQNVKTGEIICEECSEDVDVVAVPVKTREDLVFGREYDYNLSYTKREGFRAGIRLGGARLSLEVDQSEFDRVFGPSK